MMPEPPTQEPGNSTACPKNPFGHSWKAVAVLQERIQQCCRFCQQTRLVHLPPSQRRERPARQTP